MNQTSKYILELETKLTSFQEKEKEWEKEQTASIKVFKDQQKEIKQLNNSLNSLAQAKETYANETKRTQERNDLLAQELSKTKEKVKELVRDNQKLFQALQDSLTSYKELEKSLNQVKEKLEVEKEKNVILENKISELQSAEQLQEQAKEANNHRLSRYGEWETEKEALLNQFERTRNEQAEEIERLEKELKENKKDELDNLLLEQLTQQNKELKEQIKSMEINSVKQVENQPKQPKETKTFFCDSCQLTKSGSYTIRKADAPLSPNLHKRTVYLCSSCSPYVKELSEPNFDKGNYYKWWE